MQNHRWQPGNVSSEPTNQKKERCLFLSSGFQHTNGSDVSLGYHFWIDDQCKSTRKWFRSGFKYICEKTLDRRTDDVGCFVGIGTEYRGTAAHTAKGTPCLKWTEAVDINPDTYPDTGLGDHNYCRNPDNDDRPWCWISPGHFEFCDISECTVDQQETAGTDLTNVKAQSEEICTKHEFMCNDKSCIPSSWQCDMEKDCKQKEDEPPSCEYKLGLFKRSEGLTLRDYVVEKYVGTTNETCAKYCLSSKKFVCRSFTFVARTRECLLSIHNSEKVDPRHSRRADLYELISQLGDCGDMFRCDNGQCVQQQNVCDGNDQCGDNSDEIQCGPVEVRLVGGDESSGRVEVLYRGEWGVVCDDNWDADDANVVCRMLGFDGKSKPLGGAYYGQGNGQFFLDELSCDGSEATLDQCPHDGWKKHDCNSWEVASVKCSKAQECLAEREFTCREQFRCISLEDVCDGKCDCLECSEEESCDAEVQLKDGANEGEGRVHVTINGIQGTICNDEFDNVDANVVCKMLGYRSGRAVKNTLFGPGTGVIWMDDVACEGDETNIRDCPHLGPRDQNCGHDEDVGVICRGTANDMHVQLVDGPNKYEGRVELIVDDESGTICDGEWDDNDARVVCRMLGFRGGKALKYVTYTSAPDDLQIFLDDVQCKGDELTIEDCPHSDWLVHNCGHAEDASVSCDPPAGVVITTEPTTATPSTSTVTTPTTTPSASSTTSGTSENCYDGSPPYKGTMSVTENGLECQAWKLDTPHKHKFHNDSNFPGDGSVSAASNYCRNPDGDSQTWCYTTNPDERWGYCQIPRCRDTCYTIASSYTGTTSHTTYGHVCQEWSLNTPHSHKYHDNNMFPDGKVSKASNNCRAPDDDVTPWCYTVNSDIRFEYCNVSKCPGSFDYNGTCGRRPLESNRSRREAQQHEDADEFDKDFDDLAEINSSLYRKRGRIFGGSEASYGMYPWQAGIRRRLSGYLSYHHHHCGGTIIGEYWILSAAHCFRDVSKGQIVIRTGDLRDGHREKYEQEFEVEAIFAHALFNDNYDYDYDIALVKIKAIHGRGIVFNDYVQPACLPEETTEYRSGQSCLISGWGTDEDATVSDTLNAARVPLVDQTTCNRLYKDSITDNMVCAGYIAGGTDTCAGDSGGPLVCEIDGKYTVMGATSFGEGCAAANAPGVYARVTAFLPWIKQRLNQYS